jgi:hypothetical protein
LEILIDRDFVFIPTNQISAWNNNFQNYVGHVYGVGLLKKGSEHVERSAVGAGR